MRLNTNITALSTYVSLLKNTSKQEKVMGRMSSGYKINSVSDDSAGMAISTKMRTQISGLQIAGRNTMDGVSLVQTADACLGEIQNMLQRCRELAVQASTGTLEPEDKDKINMEIEQLKGEIDASSERAEFNKIKILNGSAGHISKCSKLGFGNVLSLPDDTQSGSYIFDVLSVGMPAVYESAATPETQISLTEAAGVEGKITINGETTEILTSDTGAVIFDKLAELCERTGMYIEKSDDWGNGNAGEGSLRITTLRSGSEEAVEILASSELLKKIGLSPVGTPAVFVSEELSTLSEDSPVSGTVTLNGLSVDIEETDSPDDIFDKLEALCAGLDMTVKKDSTWGTESGGYLTITTNQGGSGQFISITGDSGLLESLGLKQSDDLPIFGEDMSATGTDAVIENIRFTPLGGDPREISSSSSVLIHGNRVTINGVNNGSAVIDLNVSRLSNEKYDENEYFIGNEKMAGNNKGIKINPNGNAPETPIEDLEFIVTKGGLKIQIGANRDMELDIVIQSFGCYGLGIDMSAVNSASLSQKAITEFDNAISMVSDMRSKMGAYQNRLEFASVSLTATEYSASMSLSRIVDTDMAVESSEYAKYSVLVQAGISVMGQANMRPQQIMSLLQ